MLQNISKAISKLNIKLVEVGPRDGLQNIKHKILSPLSKTNYINKLQEGGIRNIDIGSFVSNNVPQMKSTAETFKLVNKKDNVRYIALIPSLKNAEKALNCGVNELAVFTSISNDFCMKNNNCDIETNFSKINNVIHMAKLNNIPVRGYLSCVF
jgi:hydroxymethylglutaryl-CoA lyase